MESADGLKRLLRESGIELESKKAQQLLRYLALLGKWNSRINLTATTEWQGLEPLFREGIWASGMYPAEAVFHLDIGSGAGFPAILLRVLVPSIRLEMVDSRTKKSAFLETAVEALGMKGVRVHSERLDAFLRASGRSKVWDCISWKGVKVSAKDLSQLRSHTHTRTQIWIFHGKELAAEEPEAVEQSFQLFRRERLPDKRESNLSIYLPRG